MLCEPAPRSSLQQMKTRSTKHCFSQKTLYHCAYATEAEGMNGSRQTRRHRDRNASLGDASRLPETSKTAVRTAEIVQLRIGFIFCVGGAHHLHPFLYCPSRSPLRKACIRAGSSLVCGVHQLESIHSRHRHLRDIERLCAFEQLFLQRQNSETHHRADASSRHEQVRIPQL